MNFSMNPLKLFELFAWLSEHDLHHRDIPFKVQVWMHEKHVGCLTADAPEDVRQEWGDILIEGYKARFPRGTVCQMRRAS